ncbi:MAG: cellulase family glycosylhydrolase [Phycisphaerae bacterium]|nr:cellulase family glycosylhydrolase [Phycisphaerae bacterium]
MKYILPVLMLLASFLVMALSSQAAEEQSQIWSKQKAWEWYNKVGPIKGVNYVPSSAVNMLEWWQEDTFDPTTIDRELGWAHKSGYNSVRCNLSFEVWEVDAEGLKKRLDKFLAIAAKHKIGVMFCLFDDVNFARANPVVGKQPKPKPGVHNSRWVPSPTPKKVTDKTAWPALEKYVKDIVGKFANDKRVLVWDLYNEPGNGGLGNKSLPLAIATFKWARAMKPIQPLTTGPWRGHGNDMGNKLAELSDMVSYHAYTSAAGVEKTTKHYMKYGRPLLCTETLRRINGHDYPAVLPVFAKYKVSWWNWGLVAGKQQTYLPWGKKGQTIKDHWHWDMLWPDGKPYDPKEIELIKNFKFTKAAQPKDSEDKK